MSRHGENKRTWTNHEVRDLNRYLAAEVSAVRIAIFMNRSYESIRSQICRMRKPQYKPPPAPATPVETIAIAKDMVPDFYEKGWRFDGFASDGQCVMVKMSRTSQHREAIQIAPLPHTERRDLEFSEAAE